MSDQYTELIKEGRAFLDSNNSIKAFFPLEKAFNFKQEHSNELISLLIESSYKGIWGAYGADQYELMEYLSRFCIFLLQEYPQLTEQEERFLKLAKSYNGLAISMYQLGKRSIDYNKLSSDNYQQVLRLIKDEKTIKEVVKSKIKNEFGLIINLGFDNNFAEAIKIAEDTIELAKKYKLFIEEGLALKIMGNLLYYHESYDKSFQYLFLAESCFKSKKSKEAVKRLSELYLLICENYFKLGDYPQGTNYLNRAQEIFNQLNNFPLQYYVLKARELEKKEGLSASLDFYLKAIQLLNISKWGVQFETNVDSFLKHKDKEEIYLKAISSYLQQEKTVEAFGLLENYRSKLFVENVLSGKRSSLGDIPEALIKERSTIIKDLEKQYSVEPEQWNEKEIAQLDRELYYCDEKIASIKGSYRAFTEYQTDDLNDLKGNIDDKTLILELFYYNNIFTVFLITQKGLESVRSSIKAKDLEDLIENYLKLVKTEYMNPDWELIEEYYKTTLNNILIKPLEDYLNQYQKLVLIPYKSFHSFPLHYLFFEYNPNLEISYLPNFQSIKLFKENKISSNDRAFLYGDPRNNLEGAKEEVQTVASFFTNKELCVGDNCNKDKLIRGLTQSELGHYSGHIRYNAKKPLYSFMECSEIHTKKKKNAFSSFADNQSVLYLKEIYQLNLENIQFLCLSGCSSGKATTYLGEETVGMVRGFFYSGVQSILASFWDIEDESSKDFLILFFEKTFESHGNKKLGFQKALMEMKKKYSHPFFYGGFALYEGI